MITWEELESCLEMVKDTWKKEKQIQDLTMTVEANRFNIKKLEAENDVLTDEIHATYELQFKGESEQELMTMDADRRHIMSHPKDYTPEQVFEAQHSGECAVCPFRNFFKT